MATGWAPPWLSTFTGTQLGRPDFAGDSRDQHGYLRWVHRVAGRMPPRHRPGGSCLMFTDWRQLADHRRRAGRWLGNADRALGRGPRPRRGGFRSQADRTWSGRPDRRAARDHDVYLAATCTSPTTARPPGCGRSGRPGRHRTCSPAEADGAARVIAPALWSGDRPVGRFRHDRRRGARSRPPILGSGRRAMRSVVPPGFARPPPSSCSAVRRDRTAERRTRRSASTSLRPTAAWTTWKD